MTKYKYFKLAICNGCQTCWEEEFDGAGDSGDDHYISREDVTKEFIALRKKVISLEKELNERKKNAK